MLPPAGTSGAQCTGIVPRLALEGAPPTAHRAINQSLQACVHTSALLPVSPRYNSSKDSSKDIHQHGAYTHTPQTFNDIQLTALSRASPLHGATPWLGLPHVRGSPLFEAALHQFN
jgi:hypothetical protein